MYSNLYDYIHVILMLCLYKYLCDDKMNSDVILIRYIISALSLRYMHCLKK